MTSHREVLVDIARREGWRRGAELGTGNGLLAEQLLAGCPQLKLLVIDLFRRHDRRASVERRLSPYVQQERCVVYPGSTLEVAELVEDGSLDFIFIDAGHSYQAVAADIRAWAQKVRPGGWVGGHDYHPNHPGVIQAVDEAYGGRVVQERGWIWHAR